MENNNYKKWGNIRKGTLNIDEVEEIQIKTYSPYTGQTAYALEFKIGALNVMALPNGLGFPCKVTLTSEIKQYCQQYTSGNNGSYYGAIVNPSGGTSPLYINIPSWMLSASESFSTDLILAPYNGGYILMPLRVAVVNVQPDWNDSSDTSLSYIRNKPSVEVTGNRTTSISSSTTYTTNRYPTVNAVKNYVASELQSYVPDVSGKEDTINKTDDISNNNTSTTKYPSAKGVYDFVNTNYQAKGSYATTQDISGKEDVINKVESWSSTPTDTNYPSEKLVYDTIGDVETILNSL